MNNHETAVQKCEHDTLLAQNEMLKEELIKSTAMLKSATNVFSVMGFASVYYMPYTLQINKNNRVLGSGDANV